MAKPLEPGRDFYFENGLMVLTEAFLRARGYCCGNGCRHCPYRAPAPTAPFERRATMTRVVLLTGLLTLTVAAQGEPVPGTIEVEVKGKVTTGIMAIGGETTGVLLGTPTGFGCELAGKIDEKLNGKTCLVKGTLVVKQGVEVRARTILTVKSIAVVEAKPEEQVAQVTITGTVKTGLVAPGGATTGTTITAAGATWELDIKDKELAALAEKLNGKMARVTGTVESKRGPAAPPRVRTIVSVKTLTEAAKK